MGHLGGHGNQPELERAASAVLNHLGRRPPSGGDGLDTRGTSNLQRATSATGHGATCPQERMGREHWAPSRTASATPEFVLLTGSSPGRGSFWRRGREDQGPQRKTAGLGYSVLRFEKSKFYECDEQMVTTSQCARCFNEPGPHGRTVSWDAPGWRPPPPTPRVPQVKTLKSSLDISMTKGQPPGAPSNPRPGQVVCLLFGP